MLLVLFAVFLFLVWVSVVETALFKFSSTKFSAESYRIAKEAQFKFKTSDERFDYFKKNIKSSVCISLSFYFLFLRKDKDINLLFNSIAPAIENQAMHKENKELVQNEEFIKKQLKDAEFLAKVSAMYTICSKLCNVQFFEEINLVSKDQIREIISNAIQEETALKLMGDDTDVCETINKNN